MGGYAISYRPGRYLRKSREERRAYRQAVEALKRGQAQGKRSSRPPTGRPDAHWHPHVQTEQHAFQMLKQRFATAAPHASLEKLLALPYEPYWGAKQQLVKRQLLRLLRRINDIREERSLSQVPTEIVRTLQQVQVLVFVEPQPRGLVSSTK